MFLLVNNQNIILDAVSQLRYMRTDILTPQNLIPTDNEKEASYVVGSDRTLYLLQSVPIFGFDHAIRVFGEYDLPENFKPNEFIFIPQTSEILPRYVTPEEKREHAYNTKKLINWEEELITVTEASTLWQYYHSEENPKYMELEQLIIEAKTKIRDTFGE